MAIYIISERNTNNHVAWGTSYEFEEIIVRTCSSQLIAPERFRFRNRLDLLLQPLTTHFYCKPKKFQFANEPNVLLLIGMGPGTLKMLDTLRQWRQKCDIVAAYIIDLYPISLNRLDRKIVNQLDHLFISYEQMLKPVKRKFKTPVTFIPQACDVLTHGTYGGDRPFDIIGYGRQIPKIHEQLKKEFNAPQSQTLYFHSTFKYPDVKDWKEDRLLFWQMMRRTKLSLAYCFKKTSPELAFGVSPLTARWFEGLAAGCVMVGYSPTGAEVKYLLDWPDAIIELPNNPQDSFSFIKELLKQEEYLKVVSRRNYMESLARHDWRYRLKDMLSTLGISIPNGLDDELKNLHSKIKAINNESST
jgi:hypothetical protein